MLEFIRISPNEGELSSSSGLTLTPQLESIVKDVYGVKIEEEEHHPPGDKTQEVKPSWFEDQSHNRMLMKCFCICMIGVACVFAIYMGGYIILYRLCFSKNMCGTETSPLRLTNISNFNHQFFLLGFGIVQYVLSSFLLLQAITYIIARLYFIACHKKNPSKTSQFSKLKRVFSSQRLPFWLIIALLVGHGLVHYFGGVISFININVSSRSAFTWSTWIYTIAIALPYHLARFLIIIPVSVIQLRLAIICCGRPARKGWVHPIRMAEVRPWALWTPRIYLFVNFIFTLLLTALDVYSTALLGAKETQRGPLSSEIWMWMHLQAQLVHSFIFLNMIVDAFLTVLLFLIRKQLKKHHLDQSKWLMCLALMSNVTWSISTYAIMFKHELAFIVIIILRMLNTVVVSYYLVQAAYGIYISASRTNYNHRKWNVCPNNRPTV